jgi:hypothetical protein
VWSFSQASPGRPPAEYLTMLLDRFRLYAKKHHSEKLFEDPDFTTIGDSDVLKELNRQVKRDPSISVPDEYQKVAEKDVKYTYKVPP